MLILAFIETQDILLRDRQDVVRHAVSYYDNYKPSFIFKHLDFSKTPSPQQYETYASYPYSYRYLGYL